MSTPPVVADGDAWTASQENSYVKSNFEANPPHSISGKGQLPAASGAGAMWTVVPITNGQTLEADNSTSGGWKFAGPGVVPVGGILIWSGATGAIPSGWQICNGTNGTPDLGSKFIVGSGGSYTTGDSGGGVELDLEHGHGIVVADATPAHTHALNGTDTDGAHSHSLQSPTSYETVLYAASVGSPTVQTTTEHAHSVSGSTSSDGAHSHGHSGTSGAASGGTHNHTVGDSTVDGDATWAPEPLFYVLCYVMRMS